MSRGIVRVAPLAVALGALWAAGPGDVPAHAPVPLLTPLQDKNFYLLSMIERTPAAKHAVEADPALAAMAVAEREISRRAIGSCGDDLSCYTRSLVLTDAQIADAATALSRLYKQEAGIRNLATGPLRQSGMFQRYAAVGDEDLLKRAWADAARGIDNIIDVYGNGRRPRYPEIDSISYDVHAPQFSRLVRNILSVVLDDPAASLFFGPSLSFALHLLEANWRDEAGRLEPLEKGENAAAFRRVATVVWDRFPYSAILVPGAGNDRPGVALSALGRLRIELAAHRYQKGKAPFVILSGGFVHPSQTPYAEAIEMKKALIADFGVPADAILIDPHARHTTTNMRNAARLLYRYGFPFDKPALVTTDPDQSAYVEGETFSKRCLDELGYKPYTIRKRVSEFDLEWLPVLESLQSNPAEPLDP